MAVDLAPTNNYRVDFGDIAAIAGLTKMTVAFTLKVDAVSTNRMAGQWGTISGAQSWLITGQSTDEIGFAINPAGAFFGRRTTGLNISAGDLLRVVITWETGLAHADAVKFRVNGVLEANELWFPGANPPELKDVDSSVVIGAESAGAVNPYDGKWSEYAIWGDVVPDWFAIAYGKGYAPGHYSRGGILYSKMRSLRDLDNQWFRFGAGLPERGANTGGKVAAHPRMFYPPIIVPRKSLPFPVLFGWEQQGQVQPVFPPNEVVAY